MAVKDILVHLDPSPRAEVWLSIAAGLAVKHGAHLTGLFVIDLPPPDVFYGFPSAFMDVQRAEDVIERMRANRREEAASIEEKFTDRLRRDGLAGEWRVVEGETGEVLALHGRYADMTVLGQPNPDMVEAGRAPDLSIGALMASGRPLLVVPFAGSFEVLGSHVLIGWNATKEAARAVNDAIPLLHAAEKVTVLSINPKHGIGGDGDVPAVDIALHLARHGIKAEAAHTIASDIGEGDALLSYAADIGADLLVCGMYGHSRLHELAFGGVTRSLLAEMTLPVFMVH
jgi:nucleotide-binding universal stress UspA family protein